MHVSNITSVTIQVILFNTYTYFIMEIHCKIETNRDTAY